MFTCGVGNCQVTYDRLLKKLFIALQIQEIYRSQVPLMKQRGVLSSYFYCNYLLIRKIYVFTPTTLIK